MRADNVFRGFPHSVFIPKDDLHDKQMAKEHIKWAKESRGRSEGTDFHWVSCLSGPKGLGEEFWFRTAEDAVYFKLARGGVM